ncbi:ABC transporter ATP-binding protein [Leuconostoc citreum]|uniref:ABC transporter ATP-binding protein n=1 Tax=Leuconostoc citreum TaxID=33964 RepID=UPI0032DFD17F
MLKISNLNKKYDKYQVLKDINIEFNDTGVTVIVGANGSGKTTFFNSLIGMTNVEQDTSITLDNWTVGDREFKERVFYIPSDFFIPEFMTGVEYGRFVLSRYAYSELNDFLKMLDILDMTDSKDKLLSSYSFGMKKKIQIAVAIASHAQYILADEVFSGLDFETSLLVQDTFKYTSKRQQIIIVSHEANIVNNFSNNILLMRHGSLVPFKGSIDDIALTIRKEDDVHDKISEIQRYFDNEQVSI